MTPEEARDYFKSCDRDRIALERLRLRIEALESPTFGSGETPVMGGGHSDPTSRAAYAIISAKEEARIAEERLAEKLESCGRVCDGVGEALGFDVGFALKDHYVRGQTVDAVANSLGVHRTTVYTMFNTAYEYVATVGLEMAERGRGTANLR